MSRVRRRRAHLRDDRCAASASWHESLMTTSPVSAELLYIGWAFRYLLVMSLDIQFRVLYIPENTNLPALHFSIITANGALKTSDALRQLMGGSVTHLRYDEDALMYIHDSSLINGMRRNARVTAYAFRDSYAAKRGIAQKVNAGAEPICGPVVMAGYPSEDVPKRLIEYFDAEEYVL